MIKFMNSIQQTKCFSTAGFYESTVGYLLCSICMEKLRVAYHARTTQEITFIVATGGGGRRFGKVGGYSVV